MTKNDNLAAGLSKINNSERVTKRQVVIYACSRLLREVFDILQRNDYLGNVVCEDNKKGGKITVELTNKINRCGAIKPRFKVKLSDLEKFEERFLPARGFGLLIVSTSKGLMTNSQAKEKRVGGRLIAYCY